MRLIASFFIVLLMSTTCWAGNPLNVFTEREDQQIHALTCYVMTDVMQSEWGWEWWQAYLAVEAMGIAKEYIDSQTGGTWDHTDQRANRVGWLTYNIIHLEIKF